MSTAITRSPILSCPVLPCVLPSFNPPGHRPTCSLQTRRSSPVTRASPSALPPPMFPPDAQAAKF
ncbi:hypothetical protein FA95DRAFT_1555979, partial [Auriscalpium vulgare]